MIKPVTRFDVLDALGLSAMAKEHGGEVVLSQHVAEELARTWLRVNDAPVGRTVARNESWKGDGQTVVSVECDGIVPVELLKRHRLVPEADSGGDRG